MASLIAWLKKRKEDIRDVFDANTQADQQRRMAAGQPRFYQDQQRQQQRPAAPTPPVFRTINQATGFGRPAPSVPSRTTFGNPLIGTLQAVAQKGVQNLQEFAEPDVTATFKGKPVRVYSPEKAVMIAGIHGGDALGPGKGFSAKPKAKPGKVPRINQPSTRPTPPTARPPVEPLIPPKPSTMPTKALTSYEGAPDKARVDFFKQRIQAGKPVEPLRVVKDSTGNLGIEDGKHRFQAYKELGMESVPVKVPTPPAAAAPADPAQKVIELLGGAKGARMRQEQLYRQARSQKLGKALGAGRSVKGEAGYRAQLGSLRGPLPKVGFEGLKGKLAQPDVDALFQSVRDNPSITGFQEINTQGALAKLFDPQMGAPTRADIKLLKSAFGDDFGKAVEDNISNLSKFKQTALDVVQLPRSLMATADLSAPFRQGLVLGPRYSKEFAGAFRTMFRAAGSENSYRAIGEEIASRPTFKLMQQNGLALTDVDAPLTGREEEFMSSLAEKIPLAGKVVRASSRAYTGFLNKVRADVFDRLVREAGESGIDLVDQPQVTRSIAQFVNTASGRGGLGALERAAVNLNSVLFSPRLMASRIQLLNPMYYAKLDPFVRKQALQSTAALGGVIVTILGIAKAAGAEVGDDPTNADFGKIKIGNTRIDIAGGFQQYIKLAAQLATGKITSSTTGKEISLTETGFNKLSRLDILQRFAQGKLNPSASFVSDFLQNKDFEGKPFDLKTAVAERLTPMLVSTGAEVARDNPSHLPLLGLGAFGAGIQNYAAKPPKKSEEDKPKQSPAERARAVFGDVGEEPSDKLKSSASRVLEAQEKFAPNLSGQSKRILSDYAKLSEVGRERAFDNPLMKYQLSAAKYENDKLNRKLSRTEEFERRKGLLTMRVESRYSKEVVEMYGMSKTDLQQLVSANPDLEQFVPKLLEMDQKLADAHGKKPKYGGTLASKKRGRGRGRDNKIPAALLARAVTVPKAQRAKQATIRPSIPKGARGPGVRKAKGGLSDAAIMKLLRARNLT